MFNKIVKDTKAPAVVLRVEHVMQASECRPLLLECVSDNLSDYIKNSLDDKYGEFVNLYWTEDSHILEAIQSAFDKVTPRKIREKFKSNMYQFGLNYWWDIDNDYIMSTIRDSLEPKLISWFESRLPECIPHI